MLTPPFPDHEPQRLKALYSLKLLDTKPEERFDRITRLTKHMFDVPIALVSLVDEHRQWFKSRQGLDACETGRDISFCGHAILGQEIFEVVDASKDSRFEDNPLVTGPPDIRFYAGVPLVNQSGYAIGTLCIIDSVARRLTHDERLALRDLADLILLEVDQAEQRQQAQDLKTAQKISQVIENAQSNFIAEKDPRSAFDKLLTDILALTKSEYGFIGEVRHDADGSPYLKTHAITNIAWDEATSAFYEANAPTGMEFSNLNSLFGAALTNQKPVIANDPYHDPRRGGLPEGHPALNAFLGIPIRVGEKLVAMIGIANRPGGYDQELVDFLSPLLVTIGQLIMAMRWQRQQAQDRQELTRLSKVVRETTNSVIITNLAGRVEWVNPGFARLTGYSFEEIKGKKPGEILQGPGSDQTAIDKIRVALSRQEGFDVELLNYAKEGRMYWVRIQCSPVYDETGNVSGFMAIESDITEMKRSQKALQQFKNTLDQTQDCVFMFDAQTLRFLYVNDGAVKQVGYSQEELLKMHAYDIKPQYSEAAFRDLIAPFLVGDQTSLTFETDHQHKCGDHVPVEIALQYMTPEDSSPYFMAIVRDISEHKAMMQALQEERDMFSSGPVFAITWAPEAHWPVQYVSENIAEILGYSASEMCSPEFRYADLIHPDDFGFVVSEVDYYIKNQVDTFEQSYRLRMKNGSYHWFYDFTKLLRDQQGRVKTIRGYMFDQSELKRVEQDLEESARQTEAI
ncbi:MAG: PAS domain S-box protein, partial [Hydrogenovibrio sp.]|uniref:PAS domain S-box protein n=1 Tax=Hydrogenovibrio sp. TaxID=2065821 RepID=UPI0028700C47